LPNDLPVGRRGRKKNVRGAARKSRVLFRRSGARWESRPCWTMGKSFAAFAMMRPWPKPLQNRKKESSSHEHVVCGKKQAGRTLPRKFFNVCHSKTRRQSRQLCKGHPGLLLQSKHELQHTLRK